MGTLPPLWHSDFTESITRRYRSTPVASDIQNTSALIICSNRAAPSTPPARGDARPSDPEALSCPLVSAAVSASFHLYKLHVVFSQRGRPTGAVPLSNEGLNPFSLAAMETDGSPLVGLLMGAPQCRLLILRNCNVPCCYFRNFPVDFKIA